MNKDEEDIIKQIEGFGARYSPDSGLSLEDQLLACQAAAESTPVQDKDTQINKETIDNSVVIGLSNGARKNDVNFELTQRRQTIITELKVCTYRTPPNRVAQLLEEFFSGCGTFPGWWLAVAQQWYPRAVNRNIDYLVKVIVTGRLTIQNPAKYFTFTIKFRQKRKEFKNPIGTRKQGGFQ